MYGDTSLKWNVPITSTSIATSMEGLVSRCHGWQGATNGLLLITQLLGFLDALMSAHAKILQPYGRGGFASEKT